MLRAWFLNRLGQRSRGHGRAQRPKPSRSLVTEMESLEGRALLSTTSAVAYQIGGVTHSALYAIDKSDQVEVSVDGGKFTNLGGYAKQISAGLDIFNKPEVYAIGGDNAGWLNKGSGWVFQGGYVKQISATLSGTSGQEVFAIGLDDAVYVNHGFGFSKLATNYVTEVSAPAVDVGFFGDLTYAVNSTHQALLHKGSFSVIGGGTAK